MILHQTQFLSFPARDFEFQSFQGLKKIQGFQGPKKKSRVFKDFQGHMNPVNDNVPSIHLFVKYQLWMKDNSNIYVPLYHIGGLLEKGE